MPDIRLNCPHCQQSLEAPEDMAGQTVECPSCGKPFDIPAPEQPQAAVRPEVPVCPECSSEMAPDAVLCMKCGYHLKLHKKISTDFQ